MTRLLEHLPAYYQDIKEFREESKTVTKELDDLDGGLLQIQNDQYVLSSSEEAIARREKDFAIVADPSKETLEFRKSRLLSRMRNNPPYVLEYLGNMFNTLLGANRWRINLDVVQLELEALVYAESGSYYKEVEKTLESVVPLNIDISTALLLTTEAIKIYSKAYSFDVPYKITNTFHTAEVRGVLARIPLVVEEKAYLFAVTYPITNAFKSEGNQYNIKGTVGVSANFSVYYPHNPRVNETETIVGEVSL